ncbi:MAG TPA: FtsX-like permease family protein [Terriglobales bacterium]|jgi:ABC-type antimicrobial peptide transport system permease subunit
MKRNPGFTFFAVIVMALGIAATTAMFSVIHTVLLKDLPYRESEQIVLLSKGVTPVRYEEMKAASHSYSDLGVFAAAATLLALIGIYGVVSYSVAQRTKEIGIRQALGARRNDVLALVMGEGLTLSAIGIALGICTAFALTRVLKSLLFQVSTTDAISYLAVCILFLCIAWLGCYIPARRAAKVDPMVALRYE